MHTATASESSATSSIPKTKRAPRTTPYHDSSAPRTDVSPITGMLYRPSDLWRVKCYADRGDGPSDTISSGSYRTRRDAELVAREWTLSAKASTPSAEVIQRRSNAIASRFETGEALMRAPYLSMNPRDFPAPVLLALLRVAFVLFFVAFAAVYSQ